MEAPTQPAKNPKGKEAYRPLQSQRQQKRSRVPEENRQRASKACNECRRLKEKCEGGFPCARCIRTKRICDFNRISGPSSTANRLDGSGIGSGEQAERTKYLEAIARHFLGDVPLSLPDLKRISEELKIGDSTSEFQSDEVDINELDDLKLEDEIFTVKEISQTTAHYSGEFSHFNFSQRVRRHVDEVLHEDPEGVIEFWRATQLQSTDSPIFAILESLPPRPVVEFLVRIFFRYSQTNAFYVEEVWLRSKLEVLYGDSELISSNDSDWICALLMVFAIGSQFAHMEAGPSDNAETLESSGTGPSSEEEVGVAIYHMASKLIPDVITIASVESFQAILLFAHYALPLDAHGLAYTYLGLAIRIAIQNGIHRKYAGNSFDALTIETRNRLWWQAHTLERRICILHGRPLSISVKDVDVDLPTDMQEFNPLGQISTFANLSAQIHLVRKLCDVSHIIKFLREGPKQLQAHYFERIFESRKEIRNWWSTLPSTVTCRDLTPFLPLFRHNVHLTLCYHMIAIYVGRPFIFSDPKTASPENEAIPRSHSQSSHTSPHPRTRSRAILVADSVEAAVEIIKLCQLLDDSCGLARASYTEFSSCRAALLVILAQSLNERTEYLKTSLATGLRLIKGMAIHINSSKSDVSYIEAIEKAISRLEIRRDQTFTPTQDVETGYYQFKNWAMMWKNEQAERSEAQPYMGYPTPLQQPDVIAGENWNDFGLDYGESAASVDPSLFQFDSQMSGFGLDDILAPFQSQRPVDDLADDQWQTELVDLESFGIGTEFQDGNQQT